jgi:hypothetical protein
MIGGTRLAAADGQCYRDPATGFEIHRARSVILIDAALQSLSKTSTANATPIWQRALESAEWLMHRLPDGAEYAVMLGAESIDPDASSKWWRAGSEAEAQRASAALRARGAPREADLASEIDAAMELQPAPERLLSIVGALPGYPANDSKKQLAAFNTTMRHLKPGVAVDVLLMPVLTLEDAAPAFWVLALKTGGSLLTVGSDWPTVAKDGLGDAEYISFVVDTSGSMKNFSWQWAQQRINEILQTQRRLRFFQIVSDAGRPLLGKRDTWTEATSEREAAALLAFEKWQPWSESSPFAGLAVAIEHARSVPNGLVYLISDDWATGSRKKFEKSLGPEGFGDVRINTAALPTIFEVSNGELYTSADFADLAHELAVRTGGVLLGAPRDPSVKGLTGRHPNPPRTGRHPSPPPPQCSPGP